MGLLCTCPPGAALTAITLENCLESIGQIQKLIFQRLYSTGTTRNSFTISSANPNALASWTARKAATDGTKVVVTPEINNPTTEGGDPITFGGGNATVGGVEIIVGRQPSAMVTEMHNLRQFTTIQNMKLLQCEYLQVYMIDEFGRIIGEGDAATPTTFRGFRIARNTLFVGDKKLGGFEQPDMNALRWSFLPNWSDKLTIITPTDFDALVDL